MPGDDNESRLGGDGAASPMSKVLQEPRGSAPSLGLRTAAREGKAVAP